MITKLSLLLQRFAYIILCIESNYFAEIFCTLERRDFPLKKPFSYTSEHAAFRKTTA